MGDNKISEAAVEAALIGWSTSKGQGARELMRSALEGAASYLHGESASVATVGSMPGTDGFTMACFKADEVPVGTPLYLHPQPAELSEVSGNSGELPPLPPMGYEARGTGMGGNDVYYTPAAYTAQQMQDYARAALAATGKQQVGEAERERDLLAEAIHKAAIKSGIYRADLEGMTGPQLLMACDDMAECIKAQQVGEVQGCDELRMRTEGEKSAYREGIEEGKLIASRQPVGEAEPHGWVLTGPEGSMFCPASARSVMEVYIGSEYVKIETVYAAPPAHGIGLGQFRDSVIHECLRAHAEWQGDLMTYDEYLAAEQKRDRLLALIDGRDAAREVSP